MRTRRTEDGAVKCALRHFRRELVTRGLRFMAAAEGEDATALTWAAAAAAARVSGWASSGGAGREWSEVLYR